MAKKKDHARAVSLLDELREFFTGPKRAKNRKASSAKSKARKSPSRAAKTKKATRNSQKRTRRR